MNIRRIAPVAALAVVGLVAGCKDFLTGGELSTDPNRPSVATNNNLFVGIQTNLFYLLGGDMARVTGIFAQQFSGNLQQYAQYETYDISEQTTNGIHQSLYAGGGLVDIRKLEANAQAKGDSLYLGIAQIMEGFMMGTGADLFGNLVYSQALQGKPNPPLDPQKQVYDEVQAVLSQGIANLTAASGPTNIGPGSADLNYGGDAKCWLQLAHTLKARFYMHTAEVDPAAYGKALAEAAQGISSHACDYNGIFSGASQEQNPYYQFNVTAGRSGYLIPNPNFLTLLQSRSDPRRATYFNAKGTQISSTRLSASFTQPFVTYDENLLIWAEAAYRTGAIGTAQQKLVLEQQDVGVPTTGGLTGQALLTEILTQEYIAFFQMGVEPWKLYERTCFPNFEPTVPGGIVPARLYYDAGERQTNTQIPQPGQGINALRPDPSTGFVDPANATSDVGGVCHGQTGSP